MASDPVSVTAPLALVTVMLPVCTLPVVVTAPVCTAALTVTPLPPTRLTSPVVPVPLLTVLTASTVTLPL